MARLTWIKDHDGWRASSGWGTYFIQYSRKTKRHYLMHERFLEAPLVLGDFASSKEAKAKALELYRP